MKLFINASQIVTCNTNGINFKRGNDLSELEVLTDHFIVEENGIIKDILPNSAVSKFSSEFKIDLKDKIVLPGLVECHTHTAFAGSRADEFRLRTQGVHYEEIARKGGGIKSTVEAVRKTSLVELIEIAKPRIDNFISQGITTLEIKSGYGLDFENEIKLLHAVKVLNEIYPIKIVPTFLGAHTYPKEYSDDHNGYVDLIIDKMLPHIAKNNLAEFCDVFCESTAFNSEATDKIFSAASKLGLGIKIHTEQFNNIGGLDVALKHNAVSVDHLEVLKQDDIEKLGKVETVCDLLPGVSFFLDYQYAPARKLIDANAIVALSTDFNPGSSHISNLHFIMSLAAIKMKMSIEETINAVTINAAKSLNRNDKAGSIEIGKQADFSVFDTKEYSDIVYSIGKNLNWMTIKSGIPIFQKS